MLKGVIFAALAAAAAQAQNYDTTTYDSTTYDPSNYDDNSTSYDNYYPDSGYDYYEEYGAASGLKMGIAAALTVAFIAAN